MFVGTISQPSLIASKIVPGTLELGPLDSWKFANKSYPDLSWTVLIGSSWNFVKIFVEKISRPSVLTMEISQSSYCYDPWILKKLQNKHFLTSIVAPGASEL